VIVWLAVTRVLRVDVAWHLPACQPLAKGVHLLLLQHHGWAGAAGVLLPLHTAGVIRALAVPPSSSHSLILVVIFIHFYQMFICVRPSVTLF
jgi:hypothetical protein